MILYPAIDIRDGKAVRLTQGDYDRETAYDDDPVDAARRWQAGGARWLHVVDLDGARAGEPRNLDQVRRIVAAIDCEVQLGGGLRDSGKVEEAISAGVERVVLGTAAIDDPEFVAAVAEAHPDRIVVSVDARSGKVARQGWTEATETGPGDLIARLVDRGVRRFVYTPVEADGLMAGPILDDIAGVAEAALAGQATLTYSGGIGTVEDLRKLASLDLEALTGVIVGRALYEGRFTVAEGRAALGN
ncbi:MAG: phosphoribosyl isomerase [Solirubrobacterales bacterium]|jgi:phosphoribosylformimino-5-aminoimidazole carboxamide ribotide isomerase|nr:phosphoribosyl isomerase [Solirubrobacterales bacterium]